MLDKDDLRLVADAPQFEYPAYICWRRELEPELAAHIIVGLKKMLNGKLNS